MAVQTGHYTEEADPINLDEKHPALEGIGFFPLTDGAPAPFELADLDLTRKGVVITFVVKDFEGAPLAGQTPSWIVYKNAVTEANESQPTITALGLGNYKFILSGTNPAGILDMGPNAIPRYRAYSSISSVWVFAAFSTAGQPLANLSPTWHSLKRASDGTNFTPQPPISVLGGGLYKTSYPSERLTGAIDLGSTALPRYVVYDTDRPLLLVPIGE